MVEGLSSFAGVEHSGIPVMRMEGAAAAGQCVCSEALAGAGEGWVTGGALSGVVRTSPALRFKARVAALRSLEIPELSIGPSA